MKFHLIDAETIEALAKFLEKRSIPDSRLWFHGNVERIEEEGFRQLRKNYPDAIISAPIDWLGALLVRVPDKAKEILDMFVSWGINRFSINWQAQNMRVFFDQMGDWGFDVNIYNVIDLESFLQTVLLMPRSITSDFNFPKWHYYGRGSGENDEYYEYSVRKITKKG